jgi:hypothetical protein
VAMLSGKPLAQTGVLDESDETTFDTTTEIL